MASIPAHAWLVGTADSDREADIASWVIGKGEMLVAFDPWNRIGFAAFIFAATLAAQEPAPVTTPSFDVVSIHPLPPKAPAVIRDEDFTSILPGGQFVDARTTLHEMIAIAYNVKYWLQVVGLPNWARSQSFAIAAKPAEGFPALAPPENRAQVRLMLRAMLADRFHLQLHTETRKEPIFNLEVSRGGIKVKEVDPPVAPAKESPVGAAVGNDSGRLIGNKSTMAGLAEALAIFLERPVVDRTGLKGYYDFDVEWETPEAPERRPPVPGSGPEGVGLLISNLQIQLGLRLRKTTGPVEYLVVDHVEPPTSN